MPTATLALPLKLAFFLVRPFYTQASFVSWECRHGNGNATARQPRASFRYP